MHKIRATLVPAFAVGMACLLSSKLAMGDDLFVTNNGGYGSISEISPNGSVSVVISSNTYFYSPTGLAFNKAGDLFVANNGPSLNAGFVDEFSYSGGTFTYMGDYTGFTTPRAIAFDSSGNLFVADQSSSDITEIPVGTPLGTNVSSNVVVSDLKFPPKDHVQQRGGQHQRPDRDDGAEWSERRHLGRGKCFCGQHEFRRCS
jgi:DNA-binding beta-propeller fold protein YncE